MATTTIPKPLTIGSKVPWWVLILGVIGLGLAFLLPALRLGVGVSPDSAAYLGAARNLAAGKGVTVPFGEVIDGPLTQFPPLYPILLAVPGFLGGDPIASAGVIQALLLAGNTVVIALMIGKIAGTRPWAAAAGAALVTLSPNFLAIHQMAWAEGLFIWLTLLAILAIADYLQTARPALLWVGAALAGLATLTRYAGAAFIGALAVGVVWWGAGKLGQRLGRGLAFTLAASLPPALWLLYTALQTGAATSRQLGLHPPGAEHLRQLITTLAAWLWVPETVAMVVKLGALLLAAAGWVFLLRRALPGFSLKSPRLELLLGLAILAYGLFIGASLTLMDANIPLDQRILFPAWGCFATLTLGLLAKSLPQGGRGIAVAGVIWLVLTAAACWQDYQWAKGLYTAGNNYNTPNRASEQMIAQILALPEETLIYSNSPEAVYLQTGRSAYRLPRKVNLMSQQANEAFAQELADVKQAMMARNGVLIYYSWVKGKTVPTEEELAQAMPLRALLQTDVGTIYTILQIGN